MLDVVPGNPEPVKGVREAGNLRVITGYMPHCGNEAGVTPLDVACGRDARAL